MFPPDRVGSDNWTSVPNEMSEASRLTIVKHPGATPAKCLIRRIWIRERELSWGRIGVSLRLLHAQRGV